MRQTKLVSSLVNFWAHNNIVFYLIDLICMYECVWMSEISSVGRCPYCTRIELLNWTSTDS